MIHLTIDEQPLTIPDGWTILEACREHGIPIPTLCYHPALKPYGACRLCMVEIGSPPGKLVAACVYPAEEGLLVRTHTAAVQASRRLTAELLLAGAEDVLEIRALAAELGVTEPRFRLPDANACVLCGLCVRACAEIVGISAISFIARGMAKKVSAPFQVASTRCIGCGTCVQICPTGAFPFETVTGTLDGHRRGPFRSSSEIDLQSGFVQDVAGVLNKNHLS